MSTSIASIATTAHPPASTMLPQTLPTIAKLVRIRRNGHDADAYPLTGSMNIGSGASCTLRINVDSISPDHAEIIFDDDDKAWITNKSTYGTFVNAADIGVHQGYPLEQGDVITVGDKRFRFEYLHENMDITTSWDVQMTPKSTIKVSTAPATTPRRHIGSDLVHVPPRVAMTAGPKSVAASSARNVLRGKGAEHSLGSSPSTQSWRESMDSHIHNVFEAGASGKKEVVRNAILQSASVVSKKGGASQLIPASRRSNMFDVTASPKVSSRNNGLSMEDANLLRDDMSVSSDYSHLNIMRDDETRPWTNPFDQEDETIPSIFSPTGNVAMEKESNSSSVVSSPLKTQGFSGKRAKRATLAGGVVGSISEIAQTPMAAPGSRRKSVHFGPELEPEYFDKMLPPDSPVQRGATPTLGERPASPHVETFSLDSPSSAHPSRTPGSTLASTMGILKRTPMPSSKANVRLSSTPYHADLGANPFDDDDDDDTIPISTPTQLLMRSPVVHVPTTQSRIVSNVNNMAEEDISMDSETDEEDVSATRAEMTPAQIDRHDSSSSSSSSLGRLARVIVSPFVGGMSYLFGSPKVTEPEAVSEMPRERKSLPAMQRPDIQFSAQRRRQSEMPTLTRLDHLAADDESELDSRKDDQDVPMEDAESNTSENVSSAEPPTTIVTSNVKGRVIVKATSRKSLPAFKPLTVPAKTARLSSIPTDVARPLNLAPVALPEPDSSSVADVDSIAEDVDSENAFTLAAKAGSESPARKQTKGSRKSMPTSKQAKPSRTSRHSTVPTEVARPLNLGPITLPNGRFTNESHSETSPPTDGASTSKQAGSATGEVSVTAVGSKENRPFKRVSGKKPVARPKKNVNSDSDSEDEANQQTKPEVAHEMETASPRKSLGKSMAPIAHLPSVLEPTQIAVEDATVVQNSLADKRRSMKASPVQDAEPTVEKANKRGRKVIQAVVPVEAVEDIAAVIPEKSEEADKPTARSRRRIVTEAVEEVKPKRAPSKRKAGVESAELEQPLRTAKKRTKTAQEEEAPLEPAPSSSKARSSRAKKAQEEETTHELVPQPSKTRGSRAKKTVSEVVVSVDVVAASASAIPEKKVARKGRKTVVETEQHVVVDEVVFAPPAKSRRTTKAMKNVETMEVVTTAPSRRGRNQKAVEPEQETATKKPTTRRGKATKTDETEQVDQPDMKPKRGKSAKAITSTTPVDVEPKKTTRGRKTVAVVENGDTVPDEQPEPKTKGRRKPKMEDPVAEHSPKKVTAKKASSTDASTKAKRKRTAEPEVEMEPVLEEVPVKKTRRGAKAEPAMVEKNVSRGSTRATTRASRK